MPFFFLSFLPLIFSFIFSIHLSLLHSILYYFHFYWILPCFFVVFFPSSLWPPCPSSLLSAFHHLLFLPSLILPISSLHWLSFIFSLHPSVPFFLPHAKKSSFSFEGHILLNAAFVLHSTIIYLFRTLKSLYVFMLSVVCFKKTTTSIAVHVTVEKLNLCPTCSVALAS